MLPHLGLSTRIATFFALPCRGHPYQSNNTLTSALYHKTREDNTIVMSEESNDYRWIIRSLDVADSAEKRQQYHPEHSARLRQFKAEHPGILEYGGPILEQHGATGKGSIMHLLYGPMFDSIDKVVAFLDADPFVINGVYDSSKRTIELYHAKHFPLSLKR